MVAVWTRLPLFYDYAVDCERQVRHRPRQLWLAALGAAGKDGAGYAQTGARRSGLLGSLLFVVEPAALARMGTGSDLLRQQLWGPHPCRRSRIAWVARRGAAGARVSSSIREMVVICLSR